MAEINLESLLRSTAVATVWPATPDLRTAVQRRMGEPALSHTLSHTLSQRAREYSAGGFEALPRLALVALVLAALAVVASLAIEPSREAIARFFGVQGSRIEVQPREAFPTPMPTIALRVGGPARPTPLSALVNSGVAEAVSLDALAAETGFRPALASGYGLSRQAYVVRYGGDRVAVLEYPSFELWEARLEGDASFGKGMPPEGILVETMVGRESAYWLSGAPHFVSYDDRNGRYIEASSRLVEKSTLIWRTNHAFYRIETDLSLEEALRIAVTLP